MLRIHFSFFLLPIFLLAVSRAGSFDLWSFIGIFIVLHLFIYPASNGYNSYIDQDEGPIGGLEDPPKPSRNLFWASLIFDIAGIVLTLLIDWQAFLLILGYILASRAYSSPQLRLKGMPIVGFFTVFFFQGVITFATAYLGVKGGSWHELASHWPALVASSFLIAGVYPLTQIYQHKEDRAAGDTTISIVLGYRGSFVFSLLMFSIAIAFIFTEFYLFEQLYCFYIFAIMMVPSFIFFHRWMLQVWKDPDKATFRNSMRMNLIASASMNLAFALMIFLNEFA